MATGEVMGIGSNLEESLLKGIRSLEVGANHIYHHKFDDMTTEELLDYISVFRSDNIFAIAEIIYRGVTVEQIHEITAIDVYFLNAIKRIVDMEEYLKLHTKEPEALLDAKKMGFSDKYVAGCGNAPRRTCPISAENTVCSRPSAWWTPATPARISPTSTPPTPAGTSPG